MTKDEEDVVVITCLHSVSHCVGVLVSAMIVAYRTNSIKIPKTTTIYVHISIYIDTYYKHTTKHNKIRKRLKEKGKATHV